MNKRSLFLLRFAGLTLVVNTLNLILNISLWIGHGILIPFILGFMFMGVGHIVYYKNRLFLED